MNQKKMEKTASVCAEALFGRLSLVEMERIFKTKVGLSEDWIDMEHV